MIFWCFDAGRRHSGRTENQLIHEVAERAVGGPRGSVGKKLKAEIIIGETLARS